MVPTGFVACQSRTSRVVRLHLMREDQSRTWCGFYRADDILPEDSDVRGARVCGRCEDSCDRAQRRSSVSTRKEA